MLFFGERPEPTEAVIQSNKAPNIRATISARFDVPFEGESVGPKLRGKVAGIDYLRTRADGGFELHIHAEITTDDGQKISLQSVDVSVCTRPKADWQFAVGAAFRESFTFALPD
jgi:hypothetical protein